MSEVSINIDLIDVISILAVIISPIIVLVLQRKSDKRRERYEVFQTLYRNRVFYWSTLESVNALNSIDVVFYECRNVTESWKRYYDYLVVDGGKDSSIIMSLQNDILSEMAKSLNYQMLSVDGIHIPYHPVSLDQESTVKMAYDLILTELATKMLNQDNHSTSDSVSNETSHYKGREE